MASSEVGSIVLDIDSPGGVASGIAEMADEIRSARGSKKVVAVANHSAASAAYWLASAADELVVTKSGRVGAIGVYTAHENHAAQLAAEGVQTTLVSAGKFKTEGNPFEPLGDEARAHMQEMVDDMYGMFVASVAKGRGVSVNEVRNGFGQGRLEMGRKAVALGMADRVGSIDQVVSELLQGGRRPAAAVAASTVEEFEAAEHSAEMAEAEQTYDSLVKGTWVERDASRYRGHRELAVHHGQHVDERRDAHPRRRDRSSWRSSARRSPATRTPRTRTTTPSASRRRNLRGARRPRRGRRGSH